MKLALELRGRSRPGLLDSFAAERLAADRHVLMVSDRLHQLAYRSVESARTGIVPDPPTEAEVAAMVQSRSMLDVSYAGSSLVGEYPAGTPAPMAPAPGDRYPDRTGPRWRAPAITFFSSAAPTPPASTACDAGGGGWWRYAMASVIPAAPGWQLESRSWCAQTGTSASGPRPTRPD